MSKHRKQPKTLGYPQAQGYRCGNTVSWLTYDQRSDAEQAKIAAEHNAAIDAANGYNFRHFVPGTIRTLEDGRFEVCIP